MLLPDKHISFGESLLGFGAHLLPLIDRPITVDALWRKHQKVASTYPAYQSFDNLILSLDALFAMGLLDLTEAGEIQRHSFDRSEKCA
jgi:hypothetical protein